METRVLSFRLPLGWTKLLDSTARQYHFNGRGEMLQLAISEAVYNSLRGKKVKRGRIEAPTEIITCRLPLATLEAITTVCCIQVKDTLSVWAASAVFQWYKALLKEDNRQQKNNMYWLWLRDYAKNYRDKVSVYNTFGGIK